MGNCLCPASKQSDNENPFLNNQSEEKSSRQVVQNKPTDGKNLKGSDSKIELEKETTMIYSNNSNSASEKISIDSFNILKVFYSKKVLGRGAFGKVVLVEKKDPNLMPNEISRLYAMKILKKEVIAKRNQKIHTKAERDILQSMNCPFIVKLQYAFQSPDKLYMVMDFCQGGF